MASHALCCEYQALVAPHSIAPTKHFSTVKLHAAMAATCGTSEKYKRWDNWAAGASAHLQLMPLTL